MSDATRKMGHVQDFKVYLRTLLLLFALTGVTIFAAQFDFGILNNLIAVLIAMVKASLVVLFFMHGKYEGKLTWAFIYYPLLLLIVLLGALFLDYGFRDKDDVAIQAKIARPHDDHGKGGDHGEPKDGEAHGAPADAHGEDASEPEDGDHGADEADQPQSDPVDETHADEAPTTDGEDMAAEADASETAAVAASAGWGDLPGDAAKGREKARLICIACHVIDELGQTLPGAPPFAESANKAEVTPDYLRDWFKDPAKMKPGTLMPNFGLSDEEIEDLIAFLKTYQN